jgi:hypothetical protein
VRNILKNNKNVFQLVMIQTAFTHLGVLAVTTAFFSTEKVFDFGGSFFKVVAAWRRWRLKEDNTTTHLDKRTNGKYKRNNAEQGNKEYCRTRKIHQVKKIIERSKVKMIWKQLWNFYSLDYKISMGFRQPFGLFSLIIILKTLKSDALHFKNALRFDCNILESNPVK